MRGGGDEEVSAEQQQRTLSVVSTAVSVVAAVFLGGGFYYGMTKQQKALAEEEKNSGKSSTSKKEFKPKSATFFEKKTGSGQASSAQYGGLESAFRSDARLTELRERLQKTPRSQKTAVGIQSKQLDFEGLGEVKREILDVIADEVKEEKLKGDK
ncbi:hypothetical protein ON010_g12077 [Phytophthora cinnamomi]|nr:hypothetical protein ON010_g12077 [Phytophthora cinnamomi]